MGGAGFRLTCAAPHPEAVAAGRGTFPSLGPCERPRELRELQRARGRHALQPIATTPAMSKPPKPARRDAYRRRESSLLNLPGLTGKAGESTLDAQRQPNAFRDTRRVYGFLLGSRIQIAQVGGDGNSQSTKGRAR